MRHASPGMFLPAVLAAAFALAMPLTSWGFDADEAKSLARQNGCLKCHSIQDVPGIDKDGPPWAKVAVKYHGKPGAEEKLIHHVTSGEMAKFPDGHEEAHKIIKTKDMNEIRNLIQWILGL